MITQLHYGTNPDGADGSQVVGAASNDGNGLYQEPLSWTKSPKSASPLPLRLACIPHYVSTTLESYPNTPTVTMSYAVASVLTALGRDRDERAQAVAVVAFAKMAAAVDKHTAGR